MGHGEMAHDFFLYSSHRRSEGASQQLRDSLGRRRILTVRLTHYARYTTSFGCAQVDLGSVSL